jgi:dTDP-4-dehydrorhamnose reductase
MRVLMLGANGQLGTDLQRVFEPDKQITSIPVTRAQLDVEDLNSIATSLDAFDFDILINCTSYHKTDEVEENGTKAAIINGLAVRKLAEYCQNHFRKLFHISTDYVFSGNTSVPYTEVDCPAPLNVYGATKYLGENLALRTCESSYILRVASLFGVAGASGKGGNFVETMIRVGKEKGELKVVNDITMSPTSTKSIARMIQKMLQENVTPGIYHAVNSGQSTWYEFAKRIIETAQVKTSVVPVGSNEFPTKALRPPFSVLNNQKLINEIGAIEPWEDALQEYLQDKGYL